METSRSTLAELRGRVKQTGVMHGVKDAVESSSANDWAKLEQILRDSGAVFWEVDVNGMFTYASSSFSELLGYEPQELIGVRHVDSFYPAEMSPELKAELLNGWLSWHRPFHHEEVPLVTKSGAVVWVTSRGVPFFDGEGKLLGFRGTDIDITRRREAEAKARASDRLLLEQISEAPVAIAYTTFGSNALRLNRAFIELFGYAAEEIPTVEEWFQRAYPDAAYREEVMRASAEMMEGAKAGKKPDAPREFLITCKDGTVRDIEIAAAMVGDCFFGTFIDRTARKRALAGLAESEKRFREMVDRSPVPISYTLEGGNVLRFNQAFVDAFGWTEEDLPTYGVWFEKIYPDPAYRREVLEAWDAAVREASHAEGRIATRVYRMAAKDGSTREVEISAVLIAGEMFGTFLDLTERNRAERLLRESQEQLARVGRVSTLGQFAASLAHELEQPLGAILNNAEAAKLMLARETPDAGELRAIVEDILADDRRAGAVLDRIRGMVRARDLEVAAVPAGELLHDVARMVRPVAAARGIALEISCEPDTPAIKGDAVLLQQALLNLALNSMEAVGARKDGRIEMQAGEGAPGKVEISVGDNGCGVPPEKFPSLVEPFFTTKRDGLGMGLPLVQSITEQHGGKLRLSNQPGRGLAVYLTLPAHEG